MWCKGQIVAPKEQRSDTTCMLCHRVFCKACGADELQAAWEAWILHPSVASKLEGRKVRDDEYVCTHCKRPDSGCSYSVEAAVKKRALAALEAKDPRITVLDLVCKELGVPLRHFQAEVDSDPVFHKKSREELAELVWHVFLQRDEGRRPPVVPSVGTQHVTAEIRASLTEFFQWVPSEFTDRVTISDVMAHVSRPAVAPRKRALVAGKEPEPKRVQSQLHDE